MANLKEVRSRIQSVSSTQQITKAMKMVAAAKLRRAQDNIIRMRPYALRLNTILANLTRTADADINSDYGVAREVRKVLVIAITSDRGLAGAFNSNVFKGVNALIAERYAKLPATSIAVLAIGKKAHDYYTPRAVPWATSRIFSLSCPSRRCAKRRKWAWTASAMAPTMRW